MVNLSRQHFVGMIAPAFLNLTSLRTLYLNDNNLMGLIPDGLSKLTQLEVLDVSNNNLFGKVTDFSSSVKLTTMPGNTLLQRNGTASHGKAFGAATDTKTSGSIIAAINVAILDFAIFKYHWHILPILICFLVLLLNIRNSHEKLWQKEKHDNWKPLVKNNRYIVVARVVVYMWWC